MTTVGVIGLGAIGQGVARAVHAAGFPLVVCDVVPAATEPFSGLAHIAADAVEVGARSDVAIVAVVNDEQLLAVTSGPEGLLTTASAGTVVLVLSTVSVAALGALAGSALRRDVDVLDCGVSGGPGASASGSLVTMVGGDEAVLERHRAVLDSFSSLVVHMGPLGSGLKAKLARNLVQYASWLAAYEGQRLAEAAGIELSRLAQVIKASDQLIGGITTLMWRATVEPFGEGDDAGIVGAMRNGAGLATKDLQAAIELSGDLGIGLPLAEMTLARCQALFGLGVDPASRTSPGSQETPTQGGAE